MLESLTLPLLVSLLVVGAIFILALPAIPAPALLICIVVSRSFTDIGAASTGSLLPSSLLSGLVALVSMLLLIPRQSGTIARAWWFHLTAVIVVVGTAACVGLLHFGLDGFIFRELLRSLSIIAVFVGAVRLVRNGRWSLLRLVSVVVLPAGILLIVGYVLQIAPLMQSGGRAVGSFSHANAAAAFFGLGVVLCLWAPGGRARLKFTTGAVSALALLLTQSIGSVAAVVVAMLLPAFLSSRLRIAAKLWILAAVVGGTVVVLTSTGLGDRLAQLRGFTGTIAAESGRTSSDSLAWRLLNWRLLVALWRERPWFGYGLGSTSEEVMPLGGPPHSLFVQLLVEGGVVGVLATLVILTCVAVSVRQSVAVGHAQGTALLAVAIFVVVLGSESNLLGYTAADYLFAIGLPFFLFNAGAKSASAEVLESTRFERAHRSHVSG
jgi:O-antigen ligase